jgi:hypothetical protein
MHGGDKSATLGGGGGGRMASIRTAPEQAAGGGAGTKSGAGPMFKELATRKARCTSLPSSQLPLATNLLINV